MPSTKPTSNDSFPNLEERSGYPISWPVRNRHPIRDIVLWNTIPSKVPKRQWITWMAGHSSINDSWSYQRTRIRTTIRLRERRRLCPWTQKRKGFCWIKKLRHWKRNSRSLKVIDVWTTAALPNDSFHDIRCTLLRNGWFHFHDHGCKQLTICLDRAKDFNHTQGVWPIPCSSQCFGFSNTSGLNPYQLVFRKDFECTILRCHGCHRTPTLCN